MTPRTRAIGQVLEFVEEIDSTNTRALALGEAGAAHGTAVRANRQTGGRGRRGRTWSALPGAQLYTSVLLRPTLPPERVFELTLVAAVALADALESLGFTPEIKWPNDLELGGRKVAGILSELAADEHARVRFVVLGVGVNVEGGEADFPEEIRARATTLQAASGRLVEVPVLAAAFYERLEAWLDRHLAEGFGVVLGAWRRRSSTLGAQVRALVEGQFLDGLAEDVDETGALLLRDAAGVRHRIVAGEVTNLRRA